MFVTKGAASAFLLSDLLSKGESGEAYRLTHDAKAVTFTLGEKNDRHERHSHKAVREISKSKQPGRHNQCLPGLPANRRGYHLEKQEIRTSDRLRSKVRISYVWWT